MWVPGICRAYYVRCYAQDGALWDPLVRVSVPRQQQIIDTINRTLMACPCAGFCFIGKPATGKTFLMQSIRRTVRNRTYLLNIPESKLTSQPLIARLTTLADWQEDNLARSRSGEEPGLIFIEDD